MARPPWSTASVPKPPITRYTNPLSALVVGGLSSLICGPKSWIRSCLTRSLGFAGVGAAGGGLFPLAVSATAGYLSTGISSSLTWGLISGLAGVIAYTWTRRTESEPMYSDDRRVSDRETVVVHSGIRLGVGSNESGKPMSMSRGVTSPVDDELDPVVTSGWDAAASVLTESPPARPKVIPAQRTSTFGPVARVAPVVMVTIVCLLAVGLSTPSPAGWPMLGVALLGLAASWALIGQERRIRELERRVGGPGS